METLAPLVTVAIPTYQRPEQLGRAIDSVLAQDYPCIEIVVGDNASDDGTQALCERYAEEHPSVQYRRQPTNVGPTPNFESLRAQGNGEYFLFLGDDDWFDPHYVSTCMAWMETHPGCALVAGRTYYHRGDDVTLEPFPITIDGDDPAGRLLDFYRHVRANGVFYGVVPAEVNRRAPRLRNVQGGDMLHVAALAYLGPVHTLEGCAVHRTVDGMTVNLATVARTLGLGWFQANAPQLAMAYWVFRDVAFDSPLYVERGRLGRFVLGVRAGSIIFRRFVPGAVVKFARLARGRLIARLRGPATNSEPGPEPGPEPVPPRDRAATGTTP